MPGVFPFATCVCVCGVRCVKLFLHVVLGVGEVHDVNLFADATDSGPVEAQGGTYRFTCQDCSEEITVRSDVVEDKRMLCGYCSLVFGNKTIGFMCSCPVQMFGRMCNQHVLEHEHIDFMRCPGHAQCTCLGTCAIQPFCVWSACKSNSLLHVSDRCGVFTFCGVVVGC